MVEAHFAEIEKTLLFISEARQRAEKTVRELKRVDAPGHLIAAVLDAERALDDVARRLTQETYFAIPSEQLAIDTPADELTLH